jgi:cephalosporin-C deacetylase
MPLVDKPLRELMVYQGVNPRPADFDAYWDASLLELDAVDPAVELKRNDKLSSRQTECFDLWCGWGADSREILEAGAPQG